MSATRDFLDRFRPAGTPGAAGGAGVPADLGRELGAEIGPVLALLDDTHAECERIVAAARREAEQTAAAAQAETARIGEEAGRLARIARDDAAEEVLARARAEASAAETDAGRQAARIRRLAKRRLSGLVDAATGLVLAAGSERDADAERPA